MLFTELAAANTQREKDKDKEFQQKLFQLSATLAALRSTADDANNGFEQVMVRRRRMR